MQVNIPRKYCLIWYSTSILGSWNAHWLDPRSGRTWKRDCQKSPRRVEPRSAVMGVPWGATGYIVSQCIPVVNGWWMVNGLIPSNSLLVSGGSMMFFCQSQRWMVQVSVVNQPWSMLDGWFIRFVSICCFVMRLVVDYNCCKFIGIFSGRLWIPCHQTVLWMIAQALATWIVSAVLWLANQLWASSHLPSGYLT